MKYIILSLMFSTAFMAGMEKKDQQNEKNMRDDVIILPHYGFSGLTPEEISVILRKHDEEKKQNQKEMELRKKLLASNPDLWLP